MHVPAPAEPVKGSVSTTARPQSDKTKPLPPATYGLCDAPQNADDFPSSPVPVEEDKCSHFQQFSVSSNTPSTGGSCGGFTVVFGPKGDLRPNLHRVDMKAEWGDVALTAANCANARVAAVAWGERCSDDDCTSAKWEKFGGPKQGKGTWNTTSQVCYVGVWLSSINKKYKTLNLDIITTLIENGKPVRKRAKGTIRVHIGNGKCASIDKKV